MSKDRQNKSVRETTVDENWGESRSSRFFIGSGVDHIRAQVTGQHIQHC